MGLLPGIYLYTVKKYYTWFGTYRYVQYTNGVLNRLYSLYSRIYFLYSRIFNTPVKVIKSMTTRNLLYNSQTAGIEVQLLKFIDTKEIYFVQYGPCTNGAFDFW